jgi:hypothetical protein
MSRQYNKGEKKARRLRRIKRERAAVNEKLAAKKK